MVFGPLSSFIRVTARYFGEYREQKSVTAFAETQNDTEKRLFFYWSRRVKLRVENVAVGHFMGLGQRSRSVLKVDSSFTVRRTRISFICLFSPTIRWWFIVFFVISPINSCVIANGLVHRKHIRLNAGPNLNHITNTETTSTFVATIETVSTSLRPIFSVVTTRFIMFLHFSLSSIKSFSRLHQMSSARDSCWNWASLSLFVETLVENCYSHMFFLPQLTLSVKSFRRKPLRAHRMS